MKKVLYLFSAFVFSFMALQIPSTKAATCVDLKTNLYQGVSKKKDEVKLLQQFLFENNYLSVSPTGTFGPSTVAALKKFQKDNALSPASGLAGELTRKAVKEKSCGGVVSAVATSTISSTVAASSTPVASSTVATTTSIKTCKKEIRRCSWGAPVLQDKNCTWIQDSCDNIAKVNYCSADKKYINDTTTTEGLCICPSYTSLDYLDNNKNFTCKTISSSYGTYYVSIYVLTSKNSYGLTSIDNTLSIPENSGKLSIQLGVSNDTRNKIPCDTFIKYTNQDYVNISREKDFTYTLNKNPEKLKVVCGDDIDSSKVIKDYAIKIIKAI